MYGNSGLAATTPATADAAGISKPPVLCKDDLLDLVGVTGSSIVLISDLKYMMTK